MARRWRAWDFPQSAQSRSSVSVAGTAQTGTVEAGTLPSSSQSDSAQKGLEDRVGQEDGANSTTIYS